MKGIFSILVENKPSVLSRIAGLFSRRGFNIDSLAVGVTDNKEVSSMTIVSTGDVRTIEQIEKQLNKKINVIKVRQLEENQCVQRELLMVKVNYNNGNRKDIIDICGITGAKIVHMSQYTFIIELSDIPENIEIFTRLIQPFGITEMARTGTVALQKENDF